MSREIPVVIFLGAPGVGKGTQASLLSQMKGIPKISTGDMLRHAVLDDSELGRKVKEIMNDGKLIDDQTMLSLVEERIRRDDCKNGFILDGYPRNLSQAAALHRVLDSNMRVRVFEINVSDEDVLKRIAGRRTCPECERIYNMHFAPPQNDEKCDFDGKDLMTRKDDREDVVRRRLETYRKDTYPLIDHYKKQGVLKVVNGYQPKEKVAHTISVLL